MGAWLGVMLLFSWQVGPSFASLQNLETILRQTAIVGFAAIGMTLVILSGAIDLSIGSLIALVTVVIAFALERGADPMLAVAVGLLVAAIGGTVNGALVTRLRVGSFIVTLGTLLIFRGAAKGLAGEQKIDAPLTWLSELLAAMRPEERWRLLPWGVWLLLLLAALFAWVLRATVFGRRVAAVGSNEEAARISGVAVERVRVAVFGVAGLMAGVAGLMQFSRLTVGDPTVAEGLELDVIAAVVIGGGSLSGGQGSVAGSLIGAIIMATVRAGGSQMGMPNWVQQIATGAIIVLAVALDRWRQTARTARRREAS
ncbi:MAG: ABC transporter permease [Armatimonadota bacterium]